MKPGTPRRHDQTAIRRARERREATLDIVDVERVDRAQLHTECLRGSLDRGELGDPGTARWVPDHCGACQTRHDLLEEFEPFPTQAVFVLRKASGVAAWLRHAVDVAGADWVHDLRKHDGHGAGR